jgi:hypothetical protein
MNLILSILILDLAGAGLYLMLVLIKRDEW